MQTRILNNRFSSRQGWLLRIAALLFAFAAFGALPGRAHAGVFISVNFAPPPLPVYTQPMIPGPGYIWTPGYWAWDGAEYYWVPGTWVLAPFVGALWTPGYWGWSGGLYLFHAGYWGTRIGFYGGINYGFGYGGHGYDGGYWRGGGFYYNRSVNRVTNNITNVYNHTTINRTTIVNRTSYNGGHGGINARATPQQMAWARDRHSGPVAAQLQQRSMASRMPSMRATVNHGMPPIAATQRAGNFSGRGIVAAHGAMPMAASERRLPQAAERAPQQSGALRSAGFAPHAGNAMQPRAEHRGYSPADNNRYPGASANQEPHNRAEGNYRTDSSNRARPYRPQGSSYQPQQARPAQRYEQPAYRQAPNAPQQAYRPTQQERVNRPQSGYSQGGYRPAQQPAYRPEQRPAQRARPAEPRRESAPADRKEHRGGSQY